MKSAAFVATVASLYSAVSAAPFATRAAEASLQIGNGDGDAVQGISFPIGMLAATSKVGGTAAVQANTFTQNVQCQAFADEKGTKTIGDVFDSKKGAFYNDCAKNGLATSCVLDNAVDIAAWCCAAPDKFKAQCLANVGKTTGGETGNTGDSKGCPAKPPTSPPADKGQNNQGADGAAGNGKDDGKDDAKTVRVQLNTGVSEGATQQEIPADGKPVVLNEKLASAFIVTGIDGVKCQAFSDKKGKTALGGAIGSDIVNFDASAKPVQVGSISCK